MITASDARLTQGGSSRRETPEARAHRAQMLRVLQVVPLERVDQSAQEQQRRGAEVIQPVEEAETSVRERYCMPALRNASTHPQISLCTPSPAARTSRISPKLAVKHPATITPIANATFASNRSRPNATRTAHVTTGANALTIWMKLSAR